MTTVLLVVHLILALGLVGVILLQRSEGGALGIGGGNAMMSGRGQGNLLTRTTAILATLFIITSLTLAILASRDRKPRSVLDTVPVPTAPAPAPGSVPSTAPVQPAPSGSGAPAQPAQPGQPAAPLGR